MERSEIGIERREMVCRLLNISLKKMEIWEFIDILRKNFDKYFIDYSVGSSHEKIQLLICIHTLIYSINLLRISKLIADISLEIVLDLNLELHK
jgi:hypothetical protein